MCQRTGEGAALRAKGRGASCVESDCDNGNLAVHHPSFVLVEKLKNEHSIKSAPVAMGIAHSTGGSSKQHSSHLELARVSESLHAASLVQKYACGRVADG
mmetsp:Transcript_22334/g.48577  ORF Transcript_22334/g.48577 Transcript_22334/m.48577 type:complete len:100 (-) Transcript_22334:29-328(-)